MTTDGKQNLVLLFLKAPVPDTVKTRLAVRIGPDNAMRLYESFVFDILETLKNSGFPIRACFYPNNAGSDITRWLGERNLQFNGQNGSNLGERMKNAFAEAFAETHENVVLIGSDIPDLPGEFLKEAFRALADHDAVIGPSEDGGYYLIGFRKTGFKDAAFDGIPWSSEGVLQKTLDILRQHRAAVHLLPTWRDIDDVGDLADFMHRHATGDGHCTAPRTHALLRRIRQETTPEDIS